MAAVAGKATSNPNPTSAQYAAQRGSIDMLMRPKEARAPTTSSSGAHETSKPGSGAPAAAAPKMSFLEAIRAQRQVRVQQLRDMPQSSTPRSLLVTKSAASTESPSNFYKGSGGGGFSALVAGSTTTQRSGQKSKPQKSHDTAWIAALSRSSTHTGTANTPPSTTPAATTTTMTTATSEPSFAQVQDELEAGFRRYSRANPLGGVGSGHSADAESSSQSTGLGRGSQSDQKDHKDQKGQQDATMPPSSASSQNLRARQLMMAPKSSAARREEERVASMNQKKRLTNGGDNSSDEDVGRSALGRAKKSRKG
ncbi:hypothetical protein SEPCBS119000_002876 [Sporothrix epigloea]|uniref:Uncharacterized protein n=1 Tax=Sporothrix epigloea TaxID=1892477 RepID=A0ABP0DIH7_9PEZI